MKQSRLILVASVFVTIGLYYIPFGRSIAYPFIMLSTLAHEMGHGLTGLLVGANFNSFSMWADGSGVAEITGQASRISRGLIAAGGLVGPSIVATFLFVLAQSASLSRLTLSALGVLLIIAEFMVVRNFYGLFFVGALAGIFLLLAQAKPEWLAQTSLVFIATQLSLSVFSRSDYLFTPTAQTSAGAMPSDVAMMAQALVLPYWFWGGCCGIFSIVVLSLGLWCYVKQS